MTSAMGYSMSAYSASKKQVNFNNKDLPLDEELQSDVESVDISEEEKQNPTKYKVETIAEENCSTNSS